MRAIPTIILCKRGLATGWIAAKAEGFAGLNDAFLQQHGGIRQGV
jgi:hypothetical protein